MRLRRSTNEVCRVLGILRLPQRSLQPTRRADLPAPFDSDDAIVPPSLEHVTRDARRPKEALTHPNVVWCKKAAEARSVLVESPK